MTALVEGKHPAEVVLSEAAGSRSRDAIVLASGHGVVAAGTVVGKVTATGKYVPSTVGGVSGETGGEVASAVTLYEGDTTSADANVAALTRDAEVNGKVLTYDVSADTTPEQTAKNVQLAAVGIIVR